MSAPGQPGPAGPAGPPPQGGVDGVQVAELLADLQALVEWERLRGAVLLPAAPRPTAPAPRPTAPAPRPTAPAPRPTAPAPRPTAPAPRPTAPAPHPTAPAPRPTAPAPRPTAPAPVALDPRWTALASARVLTGVELQEALRAAVRRPDPAARLLGVREAMGDCHRCRLCEGRKSLVFGVGDPAARLLVLGEGPGEQEDLRGEPFVGPAGAMLDGMLERVLGLRRHQVYILNMVKCRPPRNRNPQDDEIEACRPFLRAQLASVRPDLVLVLGSVASKALLGEGITAARGRWHGLAWPGGGARAMATFHPAYLLRKPEDKRLTFEDLKLVKAALDVLPPRS